METALLLPRCTAYATAMAYATKDVSSLFQPDHELLFFKDITYVDCGLDSKGGNKGIFLFPYGSVVMWGLSEQEEKETLQQLKKIESSPTETVERESMAYEYGERAAIVQDRVVLPSLAISSKLAFSYGLAQAAKLSQFEGTVKKTIDTTRSIPENLAKHGRISLKKKEIRKKMGELFIERSSFNLHFDVLEIPEYFWEHPDLEPLYNQIATHLELGRRIEVLNQRLDVIHDLFEMLGTELNHQHSSKLEWIIIVLIVFEVLMSIWKELA